MTGPREREREILNRPYDGFPSHRRHVALALTLRRDFAQIGPRLCMSVGGVSVGTRVRDGVHHEVDGLLACARARQVVRRRLDDESRAFAPRACGVDREGLERRKARGIPRAARLGRER